MDRYEYGIRRSAIVPNTSTPARYANEGIDGQGTMILDDEEIELHQGVVVYVPRGVKHKAIGKLKVLTVCIPRGVLQDVHEVE